MPHRLASWVSLVGVVAAVAGSAQATAGTKPIDVEQSTLTVFAYKSGLFSAFADNHIIKAPIAGGSISDDSPLKVDLTVRAADRRVLDPDLSANKRAHVQALVVVASVLVRSWWLSR